MRHASVRSVESHGARDGKNARPAGRTEDIPASVLTPTVCLLSPVDAHGGSPAKSRMARLTYGGLSEVAQGQRLGTSAANSYCRIRVDGLCYDTLPVEAMPFLVAMPDKTPCALS